MKLLLFFLLISFPLAAQKNSKDLKTLASWMSGKFTSEEQARTDKDFFNIHLSVVPVWKDRTDGIWLYVEQAAAESLDKPYRQRIYQLKKEGGKIQSIIYTLPNPLRFANSPSKVETLSFDSVSTRIGCEVILLKKDKKSFSGSTREKECTSELRGARYATTEVTITSNQMISWDRGYDANDKQVWGAVKGGYVFKKIPEQ